MYAIGQAVNIDPINVPHQRPGTSNPKVYPNRYSNGGATTYKAMKTIIMLYFKRPSPRIAPIITDLIPSSYKQKA
jgi:hypothetical protein